MSAQMKPFSKSVWMTPAAAGALVPSCRGIHNRDHDDGGGEGWGDNTAHVGVFPTGINHAGTLVVPPDSSAEDQHALLTRMVQALTSSSPAVKKWMSRRVLYLQEGMSECAREGTT
jgi:hypothetical protein